MTKRFSIRRATTADAAAILLCLHEAFAPYRDQYTPEAYTDTTLSPQTIRRRLATQDVFVAIDAGDNIVGTIGGSLASNDEGHIRGMAVLPDWQGSGVAQALLNAIEDHLRSRGCHRITLDTTAPLERAIRFYQRNGYAPTGKVTDFFGMPLYEHEKGL